MLTITVAQDGSGDFASVSEAVLAVPYACAAEIRIGPGVYREKLVCEKQDITLIGAGMESTRIVWGDSGKLPHPDGRPTLCRRRSGRRMASLARAALRPAARRPSITGTARSREISILFLAARTLCLSSAPSAP